MKNILLSSAAIALLAGAASAEVTWSGDAEIGYNDDYNGGVFWDAGLYVNMSQELNNGWTVSGALDIDLTEDDGTDDDDVDSFALGDVESSDWVLTLSNDMFVMTAGDIDLAASKFSFVGSADEDLSGDEASDFDDIESIQAGLMVSADFGAYDVALSTIIDDEGDAEALQFYAGAELGMVDLGLLYAEEDEIYAGGLAQNEVIILSADVSFGGADLLFNAGEVADNTVYGIEVAYPVGPVTVGAYYFDVDSVGEGYGVSAEYSDGPLTIAAYYQEEFDAEEYAIEGSYDFGMGLVVKAGYIDGDNDGVSGFGDDDDLAGYVAAEYDLGGGATFLASYVDPNSLAAEGSDEIEIFDGTEYKPGTTLALNFEF